MRLDFALLTREAYKVQKKDHTAARGKVEVGSWDDIFNVAGWRPQENTRWTSDGRKDTTKDTKMVGMEATTKDSTTASLKHGANMRSGSSRFRLH